MSLLRDELRVTPHVASETETSSLELNHSPGVKCFQTQGPQGPGITMKDRIDYDDE